MSYNTRLIDNALLIGWEGNDGYRERAVMTEGKTEKQILDEATTFVNEKKPEVADRIANRTIEQIKNHIKPKEETK